MKSFATICFAKCRASIVLMLLLAAAAAPAAAQKNKTKSQPVDDSQASLGLPKSESQAVDEAVGEAIGYWQIGDVDSLHKYYSDNVVVVSGLWEPPIIGWANYAKAYEEQRSHSSGGRMERSNTLIKVDGNSAFATYQFVYVVLQDGKIAQFRGHTTLLLNKQGDRWVIVLNHSSIVDSSTSNESAPTPPAELAPPAQH